MLCCSGSRAPKEKVYLSGSLPRFSMIIERHPGSGLGITFDATREKHRLLITQVLVGGPLAEFNERSPALKVQVGDWISKVNEVTDASGMAGILESATRLTIQLMKSWAKLKKKTGSKSNIGEAAVENVDKAVLDPTAMKDQENKIEQLEKPEEPKLKVQYSGSWISDGIEGDGDKIFKDLGVPWIARRALKAAGWGKGMVKIILVVNDVEFTSTSLAPTTESNTTYFGRGDQPAIDGKGVEKTFSPELVDDGKVIENTIKRDGKVVSVTKYWMGDDGRFRLEIKSMDGAVLPTTIFRRM